MSIADAQYNDDQYNYNPDAQEQASGRELTLLPGVFKVQAQVLPRTNRETGDPVVSTDDAGNEWPVYVIPSFEVTDPLEENGRFTVWHEVRTRPYRFSDDDPYVSDGAILLRAIDADAAQNAKTFGEAIEALKERVESGPVTMSVSTGLTAQDTAWAKAQIAQNNITDKKEVNKLYRKANVSTKTFIAQKGNTKQGIPTTYNLKAKSPLSGNMLTAKVRIAKFLPSNAENVNYGVGQFPPK